MARDEYVSKFSGEQLDHAVEIIHQLGDRLPQAETTIRELEKTIAIMQQHISALESEIPKLDSKITAGTVIANEAKTSAETNAQSIVTTRTELHQLEDKVTAINPH